MRQKLKKEYKKEIKFSLKNSFLRAAMDKFAVAYRTGEAKTFFNTNKKELIAKIAEIKKFSISSLDSLYETFRKNAESKGVKVWFAKTAEEANKIISSLAEKRGYIKIIKSKSMTSEEIQLNTFLEKRGFTVIETDLGEWIIQLRKEGPSHMVMPAIHLSRYQVSDLFSLVTKESYDPEDINRLVRVARKELKQSFIDADMGITGANFLLADTGTLGLVTNEGNARLVSTLPKTHVVLAGIDKIVPGLKDALNILNILPKNATGQAITSYVTWISGRVPCIKNQDGKKDLHIVILDNGRMKLAKDPVFSQALNCIRCGACANVCPVYRMVGGHTMGHIYIGAIGLILTYFFHGEEIAEKLIGNCIGCGKCKEVCASGIDLPEIIKIIAQKLKDKRGVTATDKIVSAILTNRKLFHRVLKFAQYAQKPFTIKKGFVRHLPMLFTGSHNFKALPKIANDSFRDRWKNIKREIGKPRLKIAVFSGCLQDFVYPEQLEAFVEILHKENIEVDFPEDQTCCGLPLSLTGNKRAEKIIVKQNINAFDLKKYDYIVTLCASCASYMKNNYSKISALSEGGLSEKAGEFESKIITSGLFLDKYAKSLKEKKEKRGEKVTFHSPCHLSQMENALSSTKDLIKNSYKNFVTAAEENTCCGFGGTYSAKFPRISAQILEKKLDDFKKTGADVIVTECPGCILQLRGGVQKKKLKMKVKHLTELLYEEGNNEN